LTETLDQMLRRSASTVFQPIFDVRGEDFQVWSVEALTRGPAGTHFEPAAILFEYVRLKHEELRVDRWCIAAALGRYAALDPPSRLSVNVHASTLERDDTFAAFIESAAVAVEVDPKLLILEIVEQSAYFDTGRMQRTIRDLRSLGVAIAVDDVGLGYGNYRTILDTAPEYLKIDRYFVASASADPRRQSLVSSAVRIARDFGALIVAEGIEDPADLAMLREMDVALMQGYLLGMPEAIPSFDNVRADSLQATSRAQETVQ